MSADKRKAILNYKKYPPERCIQAGVLSFVHFQEYYRIYFVKPEPLNLYFTPVRFNFSFRRARSLL